MAPSGVKLSFLFLAGVYIQCTLKAKDQAGLVSSSMMVVAVQVTKKFARGWASLMDIFSDMMIKEIVPTATAVKQNLERLHTFGSLGGSLCDPEDVIAFLRAGGRRVPLTWRWPDLFSFVFYRCASRC